LHIGQRGAEKIDGNAFGRRQVLLGVNLQGVTADGRFDERKEVLVGGNVERWLAAGPFNFVTTRDYDPGKIRNQAVLGLDYSIAFNPGAGTSSDYSDGCNKHNRHSAHVGT
jgi:hypothetical protein